MTLVQTLYDNHWTLAASALTIYLARSIYLYYRLSRFKGPFGVGFSEIPHNWAIFKPDTQEWYRHVTDTYGTWTGHPHPSITKHHSQGRCRISYEIFQFIPGLQPRY